MIVTMVCSFYLFQVQKGRPSMACKEDGEKFCFCGRRVNGRLRRERWRLVWVIDHSTQQFISQFYSDFFVELVQYRSSLIDLSFRSNQSSRISLEWRELQKGAQNKNLFRMIAFNLAKNKPTAYPILELKKQNKM